MQMAERLVDDMVMKWEPEEYHDTYRDDLLKLIEEKAEGRVKPEPKVRKAKEAEIIDFASLLERSLAARRKGGDGEEEAARRAKASGHRKAPAAKARRKAAPRSSHASHRRAA
jgi:DNA end-binding protein Ku